MAKQVSRQTQRLGAPARGSAYRGPTCSVIRFCENILFRSSQSYLEVICLHPVILPGRIASSLAELEKFERLDHN
jgi:hypothetical protein